MTNAEAEGGAGPAADLKEEKESVKASPATIPTRGSPMKKKQRRQKEVQAIVKKEKEKGKEEKPKDMPKGQAWRSCGEPGCKWANKVVYTGTAGGANKKWRQEFNHEAGQELEAGLREIRRCNKSYSNWSQRTGFFMLD